MSEGNDYSVDDFERIAKKCTEFRKKKLTAHFMTKVLELADHISGSQLPRYDPAGVALKQNLRKSCKVVQCTCAILNKKTTADRIVETVLDGRTMPYEIAVQLLTNIILLFAKNIFNAGCVSLRTMLLTLTAYHSKSNRQTEHFNQKIVN